MKEFIMENTILLELCVLAGIIVLFIITLTINVFLKKRLHRKKIYGMSQVLNKFFLLLTGRLINKLDEKDNDLKEVNKELASVLSQNFKRENEDDKPKESSN